MKKIAPKNLPNKNNPFNYLIIIALLGATAALFMQGKIETALKKAEPIPISQLQERYNNDELKTIEVKDQKINAESLDGTTYVSIKEPSSNLADLGFVGGKNETQISVVDTSGSRIWMNFLLGFAPLILLIALVLFFVRKSGSMGGESGPFGFGKSRAKVYDKTKHRTKFEDVAGAEEAKEDVFEVVDFLKNPKKYEKAGAKIPKGILLVGPPGTGKTLMARAIAGEAGVPFFSVSGSEFVEMFVGVGASRVRDLFKTAKQNAPAIIFIDEIDAIGKQRGAGPGGGHDEREQTLNQILTEMDGFEAGTTVIVVAATNRPDILDKALLRPGRFDRQVHIDLPDMAARQKILEVHSKNKQLEKDTKFKEVAAKTVGFSGAELESVMNEAAIRMVKNRQKLISQEDLLQSVEKVAMGPERKSRKFTEKERRMTAYHEVGHAIAGHFCKDHDPVHKISIVSRGRALGLTWFLPNEDVYSKTKTRLMDEMVGLHGGRIAERLAFGADELTTGASNDLERISNIARNMVMRFGMASDKVGPVNFISKEYESKPHSEETARLIDEEVRQFIDQAEDRCETILKTHEKLLAQISEDLLKKENMTGVEFAAYFEAKK